MMDWLDSIVFWHWWILAGLLLILELTAPAFFFLWLAIAAAAVGLILLVFPVGIETQLVLFAIAAVVSVIAWRKYRESRPITTDQPNLNRRGHQYIGRVFSLTHPIANGVGKVIVDDSTWKVKGPDLPAGTHIRVTGVDGVVFTVEPEDQS